MKQDQPSPLEAALLARFHELYKDRGFPPPNEVKVRRRENTGSGRYVDLDSPHETQIPDGYLDLAGSFIEMSGLPAGMMAVARIKDHRVQEIEISVYGDDAWDGEERDWRII